MSDTVDCDDDFNIPDTLWKVITQSVAMISTEAERCGLSLGINISVISPSWTESEEEE